MQSDVFCMMEKSKEEIFLLVNNLFSSKSHSKSLIGYDCNVRLGFLGVQLNFQKLFWRADRRLTISGWSWAMLVLSRGSALRS